MNYFCLQDLSTSVPVKVSNFSAQLPDSAIRTAVLSKPVPSLKGLMKPMRDSSKNQTLKHSPSKAKILNFNSIIASSAAMQSDQDLSPRNGACNLGTTYSPRKIESGSNSSQRLSSVAELSARSCLSQGPQRSSPRGIDEWQRHEVSHDDDKMTVWNQSRVMHVACLKYIPPKTYVAPGDVTHCHTPSLGMQFSA